MKKLGKAILRIANVISDNINMRFVIINMEMLFDKLFDGKIQVPAFEKIHNKRYLGKIDDRFIISIFKFGDKHNPSEAITYAVLDKKNDFEHVYYGTSMREMGEAIKEIWMRQ